MIQTHIYVSEQQNILIDIFSDCYERNSITEQYESIDYASKCCIVSLEKTMFKEYHEMVYLEFQ